MDSSRHENRGLGLKAIHTPLWTWVLALARGTFGLARTCPKATVVAVDQSEKMLGQLQERAEHHELRSRISTIQADLDEQ